MPKNNDQKTPRPVEPAVKPELPAAPPVEPSKPASEEPGEGAEKQSAEEKAEEKPVETKKKKKAVETEEELQKPYWVDQEKWDRMSPVGRRNLCNA